MKCDHNSIRINKVPNYRIQVISEQESIRCEKSVGPHRHEGVENHPVDHLVGFLLAQDPGNMGEQLVSHCQEAGGGLVQIRTCMSPLPNSVHLGEMGFQEDAEICRLRIRKAARDLKKWNVRSAAQGDCLTQSVLKGAGLKQASGRNSKGSEGSWTPLERE